MKYIILVLALMLNLDAKILNAKQVFNKSIIKVKQINVSEEKSFYATTTYNEENIKDVVLRYDGFIKNLKANSTHKYVKKGEVLFSIYSKEVVTALDELTIAVKQKYKNSFIKNIEDRLTLLEVPKSVIISIKKNKVTPYYIDIRSKHSGIIINKKVNESSFVKTGERILQLADLKNIWIDAQVYQKDLPFIKKNMFAKVYIEGVGVYKSKVILIHPIVDIKSKTIPVRLMIENKNMKIYPNMFAKVTFSKPTKQMMILPKSAVITKSSKHYVFKPLSNNQFEPKEIEAVRINSDQFKIKSGLKVGDEVINNALFMLDSDAVTNGLYDTDDDW
jgi:Cu(I)/Ag(I) efflux system membrane fusion protein